MRRLILAALLSMTICGSSGCFLPIYDADPAVRARQLIFTAEDLRAMRQEWTRFWFLDMPDHQTPWRVHGGIM